ncbi:hypothetical protein CFP65_5897 [Kitasatospora sp. MMS16-BH015]|uniref:SMP-30/gluconolactonase/LRE family protein n=1 Tax=Kitasatospora sp. MMS16-BH015 TaxID=2018025 RepID=UPI000CA09AA9|nr:SMP-30/gluconolactonase/LRE family protein [Kitasatospora sp. MMS16-BH015]AUG80577.1 hypothetical protein CFP65_5897 [Kitasatospora sp. MMS16-BH015]
MHAEIADEYRLTLGEGPAWDAESGRLYWIGIADRQVRWLGADQGAVELATEPGTLAPYRAGEVLLATAGGFELLDTATGATSLVAPVEADRADRRMNDGKCDPSGRLVAGTMLRSEPREPGPLYRLEADGSTTVLLDGLLIPNGLAWPEPDRLWHIDTPTRRIDLYEYPEQGPLGAKVRSLDVSHLPGSPDGMTLDAEGNLWVAFWDGRAVHCLTPEGRLLATVELPVSRVTSCTFGGPGLDTLYITTASAPEESSSGMLFRVQGAGLGHPAQPWSGRS